MICYINRISLPKSHNSLKISSKLCIQYSHSLYQQIQNRAYIMQSNWKPWTREMSSLPKQKESRMRRTDCNPSLKLNEYFCWIWINLLKLNEYFCWILKQIANHSLVFEEWLLFRILLYFMMSCQLVVLVVLQNLLDRGLHGDLPCNIFCNCLTITFQIPSGVLGEGGMMVCFNWSIHNSHKYAT